MGKSHKTQRFRRFEFTVCQRKQHSSPSQAKLEISYLESNGLWARVLKMKYGTRQRINSRNYAGLPGSPIWKGLIKGEGVFRKGIKWILGHESNLSFWSDSWSNLGPIRHAIHGFLTQATTNLKVKDVISPLG